MSITHPAIAESVNTNTIVHVDVDGNLLTAMFELVAFADDYDYVEENDGSLDVWGTDWDGNEWRVQLHAA